MKLKSKTTAILIAIFLVSTFALASASPVITLTTGGLGTAEWWNTEPLTSEGVKLYLPAWDPERLPTYDEARVVFDYDGDLNSITEVSFQSYVTGYEGQLHPCVILAVDINAVEGVDAWVCQFIWTGGPNAPSEDEWREISFDDSSRVHVAGATTGLPAGHFKPYTTEYTDTDTLESLKAFWGDVEVVEVKVYIGEFVPLPVEITAYVDDVMINNLFYNFESSAIDLFTTVNPLEMSFTIDETSVGFPDMKPGATTTLSDVITITNDGDYTLTFTAELIDDTESFYTNYMKMRVLGGDPFVEVDAWSKDGVLKGAVNAVDLQLDIPITCPPETYNGVLVFWAEALIP